MGLLLGSQASAFPGAIQFVQNTTGDFDRATITTIPDGFGDGEFTFKIVVTPSQVSTTGQTATGAGILENWATENDTIYGTAEWWYYGNFLLDGHNNTNEENGTFSLQVFNGGYVRWTFGDGTEAGARTGDLHGIQNASGTNILDGSRHVIHCVREWDGGSGANLRLYVDGNLEDTETTGARTNMATSYWDSWTGYTSGQGNWMFGAEKFAAGAGPDWADYKGTVQEVAFYNDALSAAEIAADQGSVDTGHADYLDHFAFTEGSGTTTSSANSVTMTLTNPGDFWP